MRARALRRHRMNKTGPMNPNVDCQDIFESEALRSERERVIGVLTLLAIRGLLAIVRAVLGGSDAQLNTVPLLLGIIACTALYEFWMLWRIRPAEITTTGCKCPMGTSRSRSPMSPATALVPRS